MIVKHIYTIFLGVILAAFVGVGIAAFYPSPKSPEYPSKLSYRIPEAPRDATQEAELQKEQEIYDAQFKGFQKQDQLYNRNVSVLSLAAAVILLVISLTFLSKIKIISDGLLLGGVLTLIYSIFRGFSAEDNMFRFVVVAAGLLISLILGYLKFLKDSK